MPPLIATYFRQSFSFADAEVLLLPLMMPILSLDFRRHFSADADIADYAALSAIY